MGHWGIECMLLLAQHFNSIRIPVKISDPFGGLNIYRQEMLKSFDFMSTQALSFRMFRRRNAAEHQLRLPSSSSSLAFMEGRPPPKRDFREHLKWVTRKIKRWFHSFRFTRSRSRKRSSSPTPFISAIPSLVRSKTPPTPTTPVTPRTIYTPRMSADRRPILYSSERSDSEMAEFYELSSSTRPETQGFSSARPVPSRPQLYHAQTTDVRDESLYEVKGAPESRWSLSTLDTRSIRNLLIGDFKVWNLIDEAKTVFPFHDTVTQRARVR